MTRETVAMIGLGRMGGPMADHVIRSGRPVRLYDVSASAIAARAPGGSVATSPAHAAEGSALVHVTVVDDEQVRHVILGDEGVLGSLGPGAVVSIHATIGVRTVAEIERAAAPRGVAVLDAGVSGGEAGAAAGTLLTMVGGPTEAVERAMPVYELFSSKVIHAGGVGTGMALKIARNMAGYIMMAATNEALALALSHGVSVHSLHAALSSSSLLEQSLTALRMSPLVNGSPTPQMIEALAHTGRLADKDLRQALELAEGHDLSLDLAPLVRAIFHKITGGGPPSP